MTHMSMQHHVNVFMIQGHPIWSCAQAEVADSRRVHTTKATLSMIAGYTPAR